MSDLPLVLVGGWGIPVTAVFTLATGWPGPVIARSLDDRQIAAASGPDALVRQWLAEIDGPAVWAGWSLGGQLAMRAAALAPDQVAGVFTCASTPSFVRRDGWEPGMDGRELQAFRIGIARQTQRFWKRFLLLQVLGDSDEAEGRQAWKPWLQEGPAFQRETLLTGLDWLKDMDHRPDWSELPLPRYHGFGAHDPLVKPETSQRLAGTRIETEVVPGLAHWPFGHYGEYLARRLVQFGQRVAAA